MPSTIKSLFLSGTFCASIACAQTPSATDALTERAAQLITPEILNLPISRAPGDGSDPTLYTSRTHFKALLDGRGFEIHPFLGSDAPHSLPLRWQTESIAIGVEELPFSAKPTAERSDWNYTLKHASFREHYEIREAGLELSWVFDTLPLAAGDLVIHARIETPLHSTPCAYQDEAIVFYNDEGSAILQVGTVIAFDSAGRSTAMQSRFDGERIALHLDGAWLREAVLPLTIDPLVGPVSFSIASSGGGLSSIDIADAEEGSAYQLFVGFSRAFSATDHDVYALVANTDFSGATRVFADASAANSDKDVSVAGVGGTNTWLLAHQRDYAAAGGVFSSIRLHKRSYADLGLNTGTTDTLQANPPEARTRPRLGGYVGNGGGSKAVLVFQADQSTTRQNTSYSEVGAVLLDLAAQTATSFLPGGTPSGTDFDREAPCITPAAHDSQEGWLILWSQRDYLTFGDDYDLYGTRVRGNGTVVGTSLIADAANQRHFREPRVAGYYSEYVMTYEATVDLNNPVTTEIRAGRIDWAVFHSGPSFPQPARTIAGPVSTFFPLANGDLDYLGATQSHWLMSYAARGIGGALPNRWISKVVLLGHTASPIEEHLLFDDQAQSSSLPALAYGGASKSFRIVVGSTSSVQSLQGFEFSLDPAARMELFGTACGNGTLASSVPHAGSRYVFVSLENAPANAPAILLISIAHGSIPLDVFGMSGCTLYVDPGATLLASINRTTDSSGFASKALPLPDAPVFRGDFCVQWIYLNPGANPLGAQSTRGGIVRVR